MTERWEFYAILLLPLKVRTSLFPGISSKSNHASFQSVYLLIRQPGFMRAKDEIYGGVWLLVLVMVSYVLILKW